MELRMLLWLYAISAVYTAWIVIRRRSAFELRFLVVLGSLSAACALGLSVDRATTAAFWIATAGFVLFLMAPSILVRRGRAAAESGRFRRAARLIRAGYLLFPATGLKSEEELYRRIHENGGVTNPAAAPVRMHLKSTPAASTFKIAPASMALLVFVLLAHLVVELMGDSRSILTLVEFGANEAQLVSEGQLYRLFTAMFLHFGFIHLACNASAIWILGRWVEPELGGSRTLVVFILSGLLGNLASYQAYLGADVVGAGASGGAMGLVGCATALLIRKPPGSRESRRLPSLFLVIGATLLIGVLESGIDNAAHVGGLTGGFVLGLVFTRISRMKDAAMRGAAAVLVLACAASVVWMFIDRPRWNETVPMEVGSVVVDRPLTSTVEKTEDTVEVSWRPFGGFEVRVVDDPGKLHALALAGLAENPGLTRIPLTRIDRPVRGWVARALVTDEQGDGEEAFELYALEKSAGRPAAVLTFRYHPGDSTLRERLVIRTIESIRFH